VDAGRPVITLAGSGRTADMLAAAIRGDDSDRRAAELVDSGLVRAADVTDRHELAQVLNDVLIQRS
jgi:hypothetical protein